MTVVPIPINPGGALAVEHIIGRSDVRDQVLRVLQTRSVVLTGERRMGKTSVAKLVEHEATAAGWTVVRQSAEGFDSVDALADALIPKLERLDGFGARVRRLLTTRTTFTAPGIEITPDTYRPTLEEVVAAAVDGVDHCLLLIVDELPLFARSLNDRRPETQAGTEALHLLRRLREDHPKLRMLCLGSVGFHHVAREASGALNDTERVRLSPLSRTRDRPDAQFLARCLLMGARVEVDDDVAVAEAIASEVEGVPYYVHKVAESAEGSSQPIDAETISAIVDAALTGPDDPWNLRHYRDRLPGYYRDDQDLAGAILDVVAGPGASSDLAGICALLSVRPDVAPVDDARVQRILERLEDDHYLVRDGDERRFAFSLVRRAWTELGR